MAPIGMRSGVSQLLENGLAGRHERGDLRRGLTSGVNGGQSRSKHGVKVSAQHGREWLCAERQAFITRSGTVAD